MLKKIGVGFAAVVLVVVVATRPAEFRVARSTTVAAPAEVVFSQINDFQTWNAWNPFSKNDPGQKITYSGAPSGVGAVCSYAGEKAGEGRMTITAVKPAEQVVVKLEFLAPMVATNEATFTITPAASGVTLTWAMTGSNGFLGKAFSMVMNMDTLVGGEFEKGLADLKRVSEAEAAQKQAAVAAQ